MQAGLYVYDDSYTIDSMDTIFDSPRWAWRLRRKDADLGVIGKHNPMTTIVLPGDDEPVVKATVEMVPPSQTFFFLRERGVRVDAETYYSIVLNGARAYMHLFAEDSDWRLFYWTKSTAPSWLKKHLK
jgi:hypothetical protein